eukprot:2481792-Lingulodinium_polyedra.AAC.1
MPHVRPGTCGVGTGLTRATIFSRTCLVTSGRVGSQGLETHSGHRYTWACPVPYIGRPALVGVPRQAYS